jgi:hypothetical protein
LAPSQRRASSFSEVGLFFCRGEIPAVHFGVANGDRSFFLSHFRGRRNPIKETFQMAAPRGGGGCQCSSSHNHPPAQSRKTEDGARVKQQAHAKPGATLTYKCPQVWYSRGDEGVTLRQYQCPNKCIMKSSQNRYTIYFSLKDIYNNESPALTHLTKYELGASAKV